MQIPNKFDPIALKDLMDFPYKENLFAYYYKGKFYLAPNRSYDEVDTLPRDLTIIVYSINASYTRLAFSDGNHLTIRVFCYYPSGEQLLYKILLLVGECIAGI